MVVKVRAHKIAYMAVPKSACTSVKAGLALIDPNVEVLMEDFAKDMNVAHEFYQTRRFKAYRWQRYEGWWRFTVVRDPIKRLMSVYTDLIQECGMVAASPRLNKPNAVLPTDPDPDFSIKT